jgi:hypothetical protein
MSGRNVGQWGTLLALLLASVVVSCLIGSVHVPLGEVIPGLGLVYRVTPRRVAAGYHLF